MSNNHSGSDHESGEINNPAAHNRTQEGSNTSTVYHRPVTVTATRSNFSAPLIASALIAFLIILLMMVFLFPARGPNAPSPSSADNEAVLLLEQQRDALKTRISTFSCNLNNSTTNDNNNGANATGLNESGALDNSTSQAGQQAAIPPSLLQPAAGPIDHAEKATVLILVPNNSGNSAENKGSMGTGFFINETDIVTNLHVLGRANEALLVNKAFGRPVKARVIARTQNQTQIGAADFAVLRVTDAKAPAILTVAAGIPKGGTIIAAGFPGVIMQTDSVYRRLIGGDLTAAPEMAVTQGTVTTFQQGEGGLELLLHTAAISGGNSGGPLLDYCGRVVGVNTFMRSGTAEHTQLNFAQRSASMAQFLKKSNIAFQYDTTACTPGQQPGVSATAPQNTTPAPSEQAAALSAEGQAGDRQQNHSSAESSPFNQRRSAATAQE